MITSPFIILSINHLFNLCKINIVLFLQNVNCHFQNFRIGISKSRSRKRQFQFRKLTALQSLLFLFLLFLLFLFHIRNKCISASRSHRFHLFHCHRIFCRAFRIHISHRVRTVSGQKDRMARIRHRQHRRSPVDNVEHLTQCTSAQINFL